MLFPGASVSPGTKRFGDTEKSEYVHRDLQAGIAGNHVPGKCLVACA
jgi:hypothetical protein